MSRRNAMWLGAIVVVGVVAWIASGPIAAMITAGVVLVVSEIVERVRRRRRAAAAGTDVVTPRTAYTNRRKR